MRFTEKPSDDPRSNKKSKAINTGSAEGMACARVLGCVRTFLCDPGSSHNCVNLSWGRVTQLSPQSSPGPRGKCHPVREETAVSGPAGSMVSCE